MKRALNIAAFVLLMLIGLMATRPAHAVSAVTGTGSYHPVTKLYNYTYTIDASVLSSIGHVSFAIRQNVQINWSGPLPTNWGQPDDFNFAILSGGGAPGPVGLSGSYWGWTSSFPYGVYDEDLVFWFSTTRGVSTDTANNFYLFSGGYTGGPPGYEGFVDFGNIVAPALVNIEAPPGIVPEPGTALLWAMGLLPVMWAVGRRRVG